MSKLVVLNIGEGSFEYGFPVILQIGDEEARPCVEVTGKLPPAPELPLYYSRWQSSYCMLGFCTRLSAKAIKTDNASLIADCNNNAETLQEKFNDWLQAKEFREIQNRWREELSTSDEIRVILQTKNRGLQHLPWHLWELLGCYPKAEIALSAPAYKPPKKASSTQKKVKILAILGNSEDIDVQADKALLKQLSNADVTFLVEPERKALTDQLWEQPWDILFFAGHSEGETEQIKVNQTDSLTIDELKYALQKAVEGGLKLAILNSCQGLGLARNLADLEIPQTILMRELVPDRVAQEFLKYFLTAFSQGKSLYLSVRAARERLQAIEDEFPCATWLPTIFQHPAAVPPMWKPASSFGLAKLLLTSLVVTASLVGVRHLGLLQAWELKAFDQMLQVRSTVLPEDPDDRILLVEITDKDIEAQKNRGEVLGDQSISDSSLVHLLDVLERYHPRAIGLDLTRSTKQVSAQVIQRFSQTSNLIGVCKSSSGAYDPNGFPPPQGIPRERAGFADAVEDPDGVFRRQLLLMAQDGEPPCPTNFSFSAKLAFRYLKARGIEPEFTPDGHLKLGGTIFKFLSIAPGGYQRVDLRGGQILLNYRSEQVASIPLTEVLEEQPSLANAIKGRIVLIGVTHQRTTDTWMTPYIQGDKPQIVPGVLLQAQQVSHILSAVLDNRPLLQAWVWWVEIAWIGGWAFVGGVLIWQLRSPLYKVLGIVASSSILYSICFGFFTQGVWVPIVPSGMALILTAGSIAAYQVHVQKSTLFKQKVAS
ncbi:MAG: CHASE2 domain-containing protein [Leptolyngbyaceae cyanobacterium RU_5_1]|nr:CHASE2 domain-containing protein [Leptolyngbyaceae cyanobacterium RU_5_1]